MLSSPPKKRGVFVGQVLANEPLCRQHFRLRLGLEHFPPTRPGQFVQLQCRTPGEQVSGHATDWPEGIWPRLTQPELAGKEPLLRRPLSIAGRRDGAAGAELELIYRAIGTGTHWLTGVREGMQLSVLGPLGNGFTIFPDKPKVALIGGGVGVPPMIYLAEALAAAGKQVVVFCGARTADMLPLALDRPKVSPAGRPELCAEEFSRLSVPTVVATDDGSLGVGGTVAGAFDQWLKPGLAAESELAVYSCGPEPMMQAVALICLSRGCRCQLAMERHMACGMGTCQSCVVKIRDPQDGPKTERGWSFKLCCTDGPVFDASQIVW
jgi:dihydroorotate dehydrogenase electron transfer subunit